MNRNVSVSFLLTLLVCTSLQAQHRRPGNSAHPRGQRGHHATIRLVQSDNVPNATQRAGELPLPLPAEPPAAGLEAYDQLRPQADDAQVGRNARARQPITMGHIFDDDENDEYCECQFLEQIWQCAGGRDQSCWARWHRDFSRTYRMTCGRGGSLWIPQLGMGFGGIGCHRGCGYSQGCGSGGCGMGGCGSGGYGVGHVGTASAPRRGRLVSSDPYVSALEAADPNTEVVGSIQILQDKIIR